MTSEQRNNLGSNNLSEGIAYEIKIRGRLEEHWSDWLGGLAITHDAEGNSLFTGFVPDQSRTPWNSVPDPRFGTNPDIDNASK